MFSDAAIQFCLSIKVLLKLPLRQSAGMVASLRQMAGLDWPVPDYSTFCRRQKNLAVQIPYQRADGPLNLLVDSTGNMTCRGAASRYPVGGEGPKRNPAGNTALWSSVLQAPDRIPCQKPDLERIAFDQVHLIKGDTQHNPRLARLGSPSI